MSKIHQEDNNKPFEFTIEPNFSSIKPSLQSISVSEKYLEDHYSIKKTPSDNVLYSSGHYIAKYYKPSTNCKYILILSDFSKK